jgi:hypothetical protein
MYVVTQFVRILVAICVCPAIALLAKEPLPDEFAIGTKTLSALRDPATSETNFLKAVDELGSTPSEPASTWTKIAGNRKYSDRRRRLALFELMKRHVRSRITLLDLARLIPANELFGDKDIEGFGGFDTGCPSFWLNNRTYFVKMRPWDPPGAEYRVLIVLDVSTGSKEALLAALLGEPVADLENVHVLDLELSKIGPSGNMPP